MAAAFAAQSRARKRLAACFDDLFEPELNVRGGHRPPSVYWSETVPNYSDAEFRSHFRVNRVVFDAILAEITHSVHMQHAPRRGGGLALSRVLTVAEQLAIFLRRVGLRSSEVQVTNFEFGVSDWAIEMATKRVALSILDQFHHLISMPRTVAARVAVSSSFFLRGRRTADPDAFGGCVGAIDVTHIHMVPDAASKRAGVTSVYADRQGRLSIGFQAIVDGNARILDFQGPSPGSVDDKTQWNNCAVFANLPTFVDVAAGEFLVADGGYRLTDSMMTPYNESDVALRPVAGKFALKACNTITSSKRTVVENTFGRLKSRFGLLGSVMWFRDMTMYGVVPKACALVYNLCMDLRDLDMDFIDQDDIAVAIDAERAYKAMVVATVPLVAHVPAAGAAELAAGRLRRKVLFKEVMGYNEP